MNCISLSSGSQYENFKNIPEKGSKYLPPKIPSDDADLLKRKYENHFHLNF